MKLVKPKISSKMCHTKCGSHALLSLLLLVCLVLGSDIAEAGQPSNTLALKTNLLYDATTTPNLCVEVGVGKKNTLQLFY